MSSKLRRGADGYFHWCPGCGEMHKLPDSWTFVNRDLENPTFHPSFKHGGKQTVKDANGKWTGEWVRGPDGKALDWICHYILKDGILNFCSDSMHNLAGKSVPIPVLPDFARDDDD